MPGLPPPPAPRPRSRNRFIVLDRARQLVIKNFRNEVTKRFPPPSASTDYLFFGGSAGRVLLRSEDRISLYDTQARRVEAEIACSGVKYVVWSADGNFVALLSKQTVIVANKK